MKQAIGLYNRWLAAGWMMLLLCLPVFAATQKVSWSETQLDLEAARGESVVHSLSFSVDAAMDNVSIEPVPALEGLVSVLPASFDHLDANQTYTVSVIVSPSAAARLGMHGGTVHLRSRGTAPDVLNINVLVKESDDETYVSPGILALSGVSESTFNATGSTIIFDLLGATFSSNPEEIKVYHQGKPVPDTQLALSATQVSVAPLLANGRNEIILVANDANGLLVYHEYVLWAGARTLSGYVTDESGLLVNDSNVVIKLGDDQNVSTTFSAPNGQFVIGNLPDRTVIIEATAPGGRAGSTAANGADGIVYIPTRGLYAPSPIDNNDFSQGLAGWNIGTSTAYLVPHDEGAATTANTPGITSIAVQDRAVAHAAFGLETNIAGEQAGVIGIAQENMDLMLATSGEGPRSVSRTFNTSQGVRNITVRYRFITTEVPGGYFGTKYNDYFNVSIRSGSGGHVSESQSMNGLGLGAFDAAGRTAWREESLTVNAAGDTVQVDITVANVADGYLNSYVVVDIVEEKSLAITSMGLNDIDNSALSYISASPHTYFGGNTRIHGTVTIEGAADDSLSSLELEIIQGGGVIGTATLDAGAQGALLQAFGDDNQVSISASRLLFNWVPAGVNTAANGTVSLRARARSAAGEEATYDLPAVTILRRYTGASRYGGRDEALGGDDWVKPSVATFIEGRADLTWGDFSNMNGGAFAPHASHRTGNDADGWFAGYNARDAATAATIVGQLNGVNGSRITTVFVTYQAAAGDVFYDAIQNVTLNDGRAAIDVIRPVSGHTTHFHWRVAD